jgi:nicotinamide-nucleotide amidase
MLCVMCLILNASEGLEGATMDCESLIRTIGSTLNAGGLTLTVAESCTGGLLGATITSIPGSSAYFEGGVIAYSYEAKMNLLDVPAELLEEHGAVSPAIVRCMAEGVRRLMGTDLALAITGIAGPSGATPEKPVGLVYIALASDLGVECQECRWSGDRLQNQQWSVRAALELLHEHLASLGPATGRQEACVENARAQQRLEPSLSDGTQPSAKGPPRGPLRHEPGGGTPVQVDARFEPGQPPSPLALNIEGQRLRITAVGRTWATGEGSDAIHHFMVETAPGEVMELAFEPGEMRWLVARRSRRQAAV